MVSFWLMLVALVLGGMFARLYRTWRGIGLRQGPAVLAQRGWNVGGLLHGSTGMLSRTGPAAGLNPRAGPNMSPETPLVVPLCAALSARLEFALSRPFAVPG